MSIAIAAERRGLLRQARRPLLIAGLAVFAFASAAPGRIGFPF